MTTPVADTNHEVHPSAMVRAWVRLPTGKSVNDIWFTDPQKISLHQRLLSECDVAQHASCMCLRNVSLPIAIKRTEGKLFLAKYPNTGHRHHPSCTFFEPAPSNVRQQVYAHGAIAEEKNGIRINLADEQLSPLAPRTNGVLNHVYADGLLHLLWTQAGLNRASDEISPTWWWACTKLTGIAERILVGDETLAEQIIALPPRPGERDLQRLGLFAAAGSQRVTIIAKAKTIKSDDETNRYSIQIYGGSNGATSVYLNLSKDLLAETIYRYPFESGCLAQAHDSEAGPGKDAVVLLARGVITPKWQTIRMNVRQVALMTVNKMLVPFGSERARRILDAASLDKHDLVVKMPYDTMGASTQEVELLNIADRRKATLSAQAGSREFVSLDGTWRWDAGHDQPPPLPQADSQK